MRKINNGLVMLKCDNCGKIIYTGSLNDDNVNLKGNGDDTEYKINIKDYLKNAKRQIKNTVHKSVLMHIPLIITNKD